MPIREQSRSSISISVIPAFAGMTVYLKSPPSALVRPETTRQAKAAGAMSPMDAAISSELPSLASPGVGTGVSNS
jgi:hypothetical protein